MRSKAGLRPRFGRAWPPDLSSPKIRGLKWKKTQAAFPFVAFFQNGRHRTEVIQRLVLKTVGHCIKHHGLWREVKGGCGPPPSPTMADNPAF